MLIVKALVFDLDGTLVDSLQDIAASVNAVLGHHGRPPRTLDEFRIMVGWGLPALVDSASAAQAFSADEKTEVLAELRLDYQRHPVLSTLYPGVEPFLESLPAGFPTGVLSNKDQAATTQVVNRLLPGHRFRSVVGAQVGVPHKPDPTSLLALLDSWGVDPAQTLFLGDSNVDMETAVRAGAVACGAAWGFRSELELRSSGARFVFDNADSFRKWLETEAVLG
jgi:phosphoglycolate phosphatase